jgi:hypothetical protein
MSITERINNDIKEAMKARDKDRLSALRDIKSKFLLETTKEGSSGEVDDASGIKILKKLHKQRVETAALYKEQNREDLEREELAQAAVIEEYLPEQLSDEALAAKISEIVERVGASSMADMGKVMGVASKELGGLADGKAIADQVKARLSK